MKNQKEIRGEMYAFVQSKGAFLEDTDQKEIKRLMNEYVEAFLASQFKIKVVVPNSNNRTFRLKDKERLTDEWRPYPFTKYY